MIKKKKIKIYNKKKIKTKIYNKNNKNYNKKIYYNKKDTEDKMK